MIGEVAALVIVVKPRHPQTSGMVERFNGRISEVLATTRFDSAQSLADTLSRSYGCIIIKYRSER